VRLVLVLGADAGRKCARAVLEAIHQMPQKLSRGVRVTGVA